MNQVTLSGKIKGAELRFGSNGKAYIKFTVYTTRKDKKTNEYVSEFFDCTAFGDLAENISNTFNDKDNIVVVGYLQQEQWEKDGQKRSKVGIIVNDAAADLRWGPVSVNRTERTTASPSTPDF